MTGNKADLIGRYATVRQFAPKLLDTFTFHGSVSSAGFLKAVALTGDLYRMGKRGLPATIPTGFVKRAWRPFVFKVGAIDRKAYELCALSELRGRLAAGEVWVERSRQYQAFEANLIPKPTFDLLKASGSLPVAVNLDGEAWIAERRAALDAELSRVARLAEAEQLQDVDSEKRRGEITPLTAITPDAAKTLKVRVDALLPRIRITDLLIEVDAWTRFSACFTHQRSGRAIENKTALLTAILADGVNLGLTPWPTFARAPICRSLPGRTIGISATRPIQRPLRGWSMLKARFHSRKFGRGENLVIGRPVFSGRRRSRM